MSRNDQDFQQWMDRVPVGEREALVRGKKIVARVVADARQARLYWSLWEGINDRLADTNPLRQALEWYSPPGPAELRWSLVQTTILAIMRISDPPKSDSATACNLAGLLANEKIVDLITTDIWISGGNADLDSDVLEWEREAQIKKIEKFRSRVPLGWSRADTWPDDDALQKARVNLKAIRDKSIVHTDLNSAKPPMFNEIRHALEVSLEIATLGSLIFLGHGSCLSAAIRTDRRAGDVWHYFEQGIVQSHQAWLIEAHESMVKP